MDKSNGPVDRLLPMKDVCEILSRSPASIYRDIGRGDFPTPIKLHGSSRWRMSDVNAVIEKGLPESE